MNPMIMNFRRFALLLAFTGAAFAGDDCNMYLYDLGHYSFNRDESTIDNTNVQTLEAAWRTSLAAPIAAAPTIVNGVAYVGAWDGYFHAIDAKTGAKIWRTFVGVAS